MGLILDYGRDGMPVTLPEGRHVTILEAAKGTPLDDPETTIRAALRSPIGTSPLAELADGRTNAAVVISDKTRPVPYRIVLPPLLAEIEAGGIAREHIEIIVATGLHRPNDPAELAEMCGEEINRRYRIRNHMAREDEQHVHLGRTERGTEVWIDRGFVEADLKVVTGLIEPHLLAGYSGGRKAVAPGLAAIESMRRLHGAPMLEENVGPGLVDDNPFHHELIEIARRVGVDFMCDVAIDRQRRITGVYAGDLEQAHAAGRRAVDAHVRVDIDAPADIVITSAGGYPLDDTFYQAIKGLTAALNIIRRDGTIILAAALGEGIGGSEEFLALLRSTRDHEELMRRLMQPGFFTVNQWMVQHLGQVLRKARPVVVSDGLPESERHGLLVDFAPSVETALEEALARHGPDAHVAVVPQGPYVLGSVRGRRLPLGRAREG